MSITRVSAVCNQPKNVLLHLVKQTNKKGVPCVEFNRCVWADFIPECKGLKIRGTGSWKLSAGLDVSVNVILRPYMSDWQPDQDAAPHRAILSSTSSYFLLSAPQDISRATFYRQMSNISWCHYRYVWIYIKWHGLYCFCWPATDSILTGLYCIVCQPPVCPQYEVSLRKQLGPGRKRTQGGHHFI